MSEIISREEFVSLAADNKIRLIDALNIRMIEIGENLALVNAEYFRQKNGEKEENYSHLASEHARLEILYDAIKHAISALQSTLRAEREIGGATG